MTQCFSCGQDLELTSEVISKKEECPKCYQDIHCCKMCQFFDPSAYNECREPNAERVVEKEKSNFCDYFKLDQSGQNQHNSQKMAKESALDAANALFKK